MRLFNILFAICFLFGKLYSSPGNCSHQFLDKFGEHVTFFKPEGVSVEREFSEKGQLTRITSSDDSIDYHYNYDAHGNLTDAFDFSTHQNIHREYNNKGILIREITHEDQIIDFHYSFDKKIVKITLPDRTGFSLSDNTLIRFNSLNEILYRTDLKHLPYSDESLLHTLDEQKEWKEQDSSKSFTFDALNRIIEFRTENRIKILYRYDALHRKTSQTTHLWDADSADWNVVATDYFLYYYDTEIAVLDDNKMLRILHIFKMSHGESPSSEKMIEVNGIPFRPLPKEPSGLSTSSSRRTLSEDSYLASLLEGMIQWFNMPDPHNPNAEPDVSMLRWMLNHTMHWREYHTSGIIGKGELGDRIRITYINGMLNSSSEVLEYLSNLSSIHGGANIHYILRESNGFLKDVLKAGLIKAGYITDHAKDLASLWKRMIKEMGGVDSGGTIYHYAHSLGAADTYAASTLMTEAELKMIQVSTFGSPQIIPQGIFGDVHNYISRWDGISPLGASRYIQALVFEEPHVIFIMSNEGFPFQDHQISSNTYSKIMKELGAKVIESYESLEATKK